MEKESWSKIGRDYQRDHPDKIVLFRIVEPFTLDACKVISVPLEPQGELLNYISKKGEVQIDFYDNEMLVRLTKVNSGTSENYYFFERQYYKDLKHSLIREERVVESPCIYVRRL